MADKLQQSPAPGRPGYTPQRERRKRGRPSRDETSPGSRSPPDKRGGRGGRAEGRRHGGGHAGGHGGGHADGGEEGQHGDDMTEEQRREKELEDAQQLVDPTNKIITIRKPSVSK